MQSMWKGGKFAEYNEPHLYIIGMVIDHWSMTSMILVKVSHYKFLTTSSPYCLVTQIHSHMEICRALKRTVKGVSQFFLKISIIEKINLV